MTFNHNLVKGQEIDNTDMIVRQAIEFGIKAHAEQLDDAGNDYFMSHCWQVYEIVKILYPEDFELQAAALLHDTLEDTDITYEKLITTFGGDIADLILEVTHERKDDDTGWCFPHLHSIRGIVLKFADRASNLSRMEGVWDAKKIEKYIKKSKFWQSDDI
jgi:(p)ppGpp synthase/HD superfamily hydrolase